MKEERVAPPSCLQQRLTEALSPAGAVFQYIGTENGSESSLAADALGVVVHRIRAVIQAQVEAQAAVLLVAPHGPAYAAALVGCFLANAVVAPLALGAPSLSESELHKLRQMVADLGPRLILTDAATARQLDAEGLSAGISVIDVDALPEPAAAPSSEWRAARESDTALVLYTSGSTSECKGIVLTHANVWAQIEAGGMQWAVDGRSRVVSWLSQSHNFGLYFGLLVPLIRGAQCVFLSPALYLKRPATWFEVVARHGCTHMAAPGFAFDFCAATLSADDVAANAMRTVTHIICGGEPVRHGNVERFFRKFAHAGADLRTFKPHYGMSEVGSICTLRDPQHRLFLELDADAHARSQVQQAAEGASIIRLANCGDPAHGAEVRIVSPDSGLRCGDREIGEIWFKSPALAAGYVGSDEQTAASFGCAVAGSTETGFFRTGDLGFLFEGCLYVAGRLKEVLIVRGRNHFPSEIESTLHDALGNSLRAPVVFSLEGEACEKVVAIQEVDRVLAGPDYLALAARMRKAVSHAHGLGIDEIAFALRGTVLGAASGKLKRRPIRDAYLRRELPILWCDGGLPTAEQAEQASQLPGATGTKALIEQLRQGVFAKVLGDAGLQLQDDDPFTHAGLDSIACVRLAGGIEDTFGVKFQPTLLFKYETLRDIAAYLESLLPAAQSMRHVPDARPAGVARDGQAGQGDDAIAIVGVQCEFPGAQDTQAYWQVLCGGEPVIAPIKDQRPELWQALVDYPGLDPDKLPQWAGLLQDIDAFDAPFFGISRREAECMDPQQRKVLELVWRLAEDAGHSPLEWSGQKIGLFVGIHNVDYAEVLAGHPELMAESGAYVDSGTHPALIANRASRWFNLTGPSEVVNTACSSSLVAVCRAVEAIRSGQCSSAIVAGVNLMLTPRVFLASENAGMLSKVGQCRTLDADADGFVRSEGVAGIVLKPLRQAQADGDRIYAVIKGGVVNHDGRSNSLRAPNLNAQRDLLVAAYRDNGVDPESLGYVELHGTGTPLGDPVEVQALKEAFAILAPHLPPGHCGIGSAKSRIGHAESAAGMAGLIKLILCFQHDMLTRAGNFDRINPLIDLQESPFRLIEKSQPWPTLRNAQGQPMLRRAGVSSFGFGGVNAHVVLEEYVPRQVPHAQPGGPAVVVLSAKSEDRLREQAKRLRQAIGHLADEALHDIAYTLQVGREAMAGRLAIVAGSLDELRHKLDAYLAGKPADELYRGEVKRNKEALAVFSGEELQETVGRWIEQGGLDKLAEAWSKGLVLEWSRLYGEARPRRIALPTYPFAKERYWIEPTHGAGALQTGVLHPLLQQNTSDLNGQRYSSSFSGGEFFLRDHVVHGRRVLPEVAQLEMARQAVAHATGHTGGIRLERVAFVQPAVVGDAGLQVHIALEEEADGSIAYEIYSGSEDEPQVHSQGRAVLADTKPAGHLDLVAPQAQCTHSVEADAIDASFARADLNHGPVCSQALQEAPQALHTVTTQPTPPVGELTLVPSWESFQLDAATGLGAPTVILSTDDDAARVLAAAYPQARCIRSPGELPAGPIDHVLWVAPTDTADVFAEHTIQGQTEGVLALWHLVKALLAAGHGFKPLRLSVLTRQAQGVDAHDPVHPTHASVHGLVGSLAKEYSRWQVRLLDLPQAMHEWPVLDALGADPQGHARVYRAGHALGQWHRPSQLACRLPDPAAPAIRRQGLYVILGGAGGVGETFSEHLVRHHQAQVVWIGRRAEDAAITAKRTRLGALGPTPLYLQADATDASALAAACAEIKRDYGAIHGLVHSTLVLKDQGLANMDEAGFLSSLAAKVDTSVRMAQAFGREALDFVLFFSSLQSSTKAAGQSNYAAGCTFSDAYAHALRQALPHTRVKIVNWGYWGSTGIVATPEYRQRMDRLGLGSIEPARAMDMLERLLAGPIDQVSYLVATRPEVADSLGVVAEKIAPVPLTIPGQPTPAQPIAATSLTAPQHDPDAARALDRLLARLLSDRLGALRGAPLPEMYARWFAHSRRILKAHGIDQAQEDQDAWVEWAAHKTRALADPEQRASTVLVDATLAALTQILRGEQRATEVMFPGASMALVEGIYKHNAVPDHFNAVLAEALVSYVQSRVRQQPQVKLRLVEVGAGTGGTSAMLFDKLQPYAQHIDEYCYTDISRSFLLHGQTQYGQKAPYLKTKLFDAGRALAEQGFEPGSYDVAIATNVLHATPNIRRTMRNTKALLKGQGLLLLNEITGTSVFNHLTFGLLEGWWLYEDEALRVPGSPALSPEGWQSVLSAEGFHTLSYPARASHVLGQQVIACFSDGLVRQLSAPAVPLAQAPARAVPEAAPAAAVVGPGHHAGSGDMPLQLRARIEAGLTQLISQLLKIDTAEMERDSEFSELGFDSISLNGFASRLNEHYGLELTPTVFFEHPTLAKLSAHLARAHADVLAPRFTTTRSAAPAVARPQTATVTATPDAAVTLRRRKRGQPAAAQAARVQPLAQEPIAIIGMSGSFPQALDLDTFWDNLRAGRDCIGEIPDSRWDWSDLYGDPKADGNRTNVRRAGLIEDMTEFDPLFFGISPREALGMDPQQRLLMTHVWRTIEDAGYAASTLAGSDTALFVGTVGSGYGYRLLQAGMDIQGNTATGTSSTIGPNRMSYLLDLHGPSEPIETACSSALVAIHRAVQVLRSGQSALAIAGGINTLVSPEAHVSLSKAGMLCDDGRCKTFSKHADGYVRGEGVGMLMLKRLSDAERDGDRIHGLILGTAQNHGGRANSLTAPNPRAQADLIKTAFRQAGVAPGTVGYIEAHGTGTPLGDPIEIQGLKSAFMELDPQLPEASCGVGTVKTNIGHLELAAGVAGVIKVLLQMRHKTLVKSLHAEELNPYIELKGSPFYVVQEAREWEAPKDAQGRELPRRAGVSSFGFGGVNAHVVLQEYVPKAQVRTPVHGPVVIVLSARNEERLREQARLLREALQEKTEDDLADIAYTLQVGREAMEVRLACVVGTLEELAHKLGQYLDGAPCDELYKAEVKRHKESLAVFVADEDARELVGKWLDKGRLEKLADIWTKGLSVDWDRLHREARPRRVDLPTYPFARERFWVMPGPAAKRSEETGKETGKETGNQAPRKPGARNVSNEALSELAYEEVWQPAAPPQAPATDAATLVCLLQAGQDREAVQRALAQHAPASRLSFLETADERLEAGLQSLQGTRTDAILDFRALGDATPRHERLVRLVQAIAQARVPVRQVLVAASSADDLQQAQHESWIGLERSLGLILPETRLSVHIEAAGSGAPVDLAGWARRLCGELGATPSARRASTLWHAGQRHLNRAQPLDLRGLDANAGRVLRHGGAYLITGGLGGLGLLFARHLARTLCARLLLCGRSAATPERQAQLESLRALGAQVHYVQADVTDEVQLQRAVREGVQRFGALHGVLHAAGLAGEHSLLEMDAQQVDTLLAAKLHGTLALERAIEQAQPGQPLDFACYFSSSSAVLGDMGSGAYAMGNRFLQAYARLRNAQHSSTRQHPSTRHVAIAWPLWAEGGMGLDTDEQTRLYLQSSGQGALQTEAGLRWFERFLQSGHAGPLVMVGQPSRVRRMLGLDAPAAVGAHASALAPATRRETAAVPLRSGPGRRAETRGLSVAQCLAWDLKALVSEVTGVPREQLDERQNLADVGLDSIGLAQFASRLGALYDVELSPSIFFSHATLEQLQAHLLKAHGPLLQAFYDEEAPAQEEPSASLVEEAGPEALPALDERQEPHQVTDEPIAIIGMSGRFPGARNVDEFWQVLSQGEDRITEIPAERFDWRPYHGDAKQPGKTPGKWLAALDDVDEFDPLFFEISPLEARQTDPRQRLLLQEAWRALEDAGYGKGQLKRERVGMFVGVEQGDYQQLLGDQGGITGNHDAILASRLAYVLNLSGPAMAINTACSSGLVAAHQACQSLRAGECDSAIAAGVNMLFTPAPFIAMGQAGMLSEDGRCRAFDKRANGLVPGEAVVALVLKRLSQAERDGDPIHGVIRGSGINYDGKTNGITAPSGAAQVRLLQDTYRRYGISPNEIGHVVTHGTGTRLGDPIEINALAEVFQGGEPGSCAITSTKPHVGHTFAASGLVSLVALLQGMKHQAIPPSLHCEDESEYIEWARSPFYVNKGLKAWTGPKLGAVSAFGMSGTNAHMVVQGYEAQAREHGPVSPWHLLVLSGKSEEALRERVQQLVEALGHRTWSASELQAMSHTLLSGRQHFACRAAVVVQDADDARHVLGQLQADGRQAKVFKGKVTREFEAQSAMQRYGQELVARGLNRAGHSVLEDLSALAGLYCQGYDFDWSQLFGDRPPRRIGLPTYPFARERCWIERDPSTQRSVTPPLKPFELSKYEELLLRLESGTMTPELAVEITRNADGVSV